MLIDLDIVYGGGRDCMNTNKLAGTATLNVVRTSTSPLTFECTLEFHLYPGWVLDGSDAVRYYAGAQPIGTDKTAPGQMTALYPPRPNTFTVKPSGTEFYFYIHFALRNRNVCT